MKQMIPAVCATLMLTACSQQFTRYDSQSGAALPAYRAAPAEGGGFETGFAAIRAGDYAAAEAPLTRHLQTDPDDPYALLALGVVMERTERVAEAIPYYRGAALHGDAAGIGETVGLDGQAAPGTVRELALFNIARLK